MLEPRPEHREGMGSRPRGREGVALYKSEDSAAVHGRMGADRPGERWVGVLAVLMAEQGLLVAALVAAVATGVEWGWLARVVLGSHVLLQLILALANKGTHLTHQGLALVLQLVAA